MHRLSAFLIGIVFGTGLSISNMTNPYKILNFLDFFGPWDPTLLVVMATAVVTTYIGYQIVFRAPKPKLTETFYLPEKTKISKQLILGSIIFGVGWGSTGYCPGPSIAALSTFNMDPLYFVIGMVLGSYMYWLIFNYLKR
ncbi:DUF6691 family protein [Legionella yabuuchiae]|uniref:DUF6691 family protein n=1 Tax=Legionella yabuuchiae TaxID=376727 RepID=UPI0010565E05|nr:DUF6691 family protein [Legionella yabuuchiae]